MNESDFTPKMRRALALARAAGLTESARELEESLNGVYTTSSELLGEVGGAILRFRKREGKRIPPEAAELLDECQREIGAVWPVYGPGLVGRLLRMIDRLR